MTIQDCTLYLLILWFFVYVWDLATRRTAYRQEHPLEKEVQALTKAPPLPEELPIQPEFNIGWKEKIQLLDNAVRSGRKVFSEWELNFIFDLDKRAKERSTLEGKTFYSPRQLAKIDELYLRIKGG